MRALRCALATLVLGWPIAGAGSSQPASPSYSLAGIVNAATNLPNDYAPNTIISLYGTNLAYSTVGLTSTNGVLPTTLGGVTVYIGSAPSNLFYISPTQINVLVPNTFTPGPVTIYVVREGAAGPSTTIVLAETAPGLFESAPGTLLATHADGSLITSDAPAVKNEVIVIYAVGMGRTTPDLLAGQVPVRALPIQHLADMQVLLNGTAVDPGLIYYAGVTPGFAGLYQINVQLPSGAPANPEVRVRIGTQISAAGLTLSTR